MFAPVLGRSVVSYFSSQPMLPTHKMIKVVFIVSAALMMRASILDPLDVSSFVFIASLFVVSIGSWLLHWLQEDEYGIALLAKECQFEDYFILLTLH